MRTKPVAPEGMRWCSSCQQHLPEDRFGTNHRCLACRRAAHQRYKAAKLAALPPEERVPKKRGKNAFAPDGTRWCPTCGGYQPLTLFCRPTSDYCRKHQNEHNRRWANKDAEAARQRRAAAAARAREQRREQRASAPTPPPPSPVRPRLGSTALPYACPEDAGTVARWLTTRSHVKHDQCIRSVRLLLDIAPSTPLAQITRAQLDQVRTAERDQDGPLTDTQRQQFHACLRALFSAMVAQGLRRDNPATNVATQAIETGKRQDIGRCALIVKERLRGGSMRSRVVEAWDTGARDQQAIQRLIQASTATLPPDAVSIAAEIISL